MTYLYTLLCALSICLSASATEKVIVSVAPYRTLCSDLTTHDSIEIELLVPPGFSSHTYEPTPKQVLASLNAKVWFMIGELFETKVRTVLTHENPQLLLVDLRQGLELMLDGCKTGHAHTHAADPHIWMSPKMVIIEVKHMASALQKAFPHLAELIEQNLAKTISKLELLDTEIRAILETKQGATVFVSHPAYGYFCREYGLKQQPIEFEGKDPTPRDLTELIKQAKQRGVHTIFIQPQYSTKAALIIADAVGAKLVSLNPYDENYYESMRHIARSFATGAVS